MVNLVLALRISEQPRLFFGWHRIGQCMRDYIDIHIDVFQMFTSFPRVILGILNVPKRVESLEYNIVAIDMCI